MSIGQLPKRETKAAKAPRTPKRWTGIGALVVVLLTVATLGWLAFSRDVPVANSNDVQILNPPVQAQSTGGGVCNFPAATEGDPTNIIPADTVWQLNGSMATPVSATAGPLRTEAGVGVCFARSPSGLLLAASNLLVALGNPKLDMEQVVSDRLVHSTGYEQLNLRVQDWSAENAGQIDSQLRQIAGFRLITYSPDYAVIDIVQRGTGGAIAGRLATQIYLFQWLDDDWKMVPPIDGTDMPVRELTSVTTPYIVFNGA